MGTRTEAEKAVATHMARVYNLSAEHLQPATNGVAQNETTRLKAEISRVKVDLQAGHW